MIVLMRILAAATSAYMFAVFLRVMLTWFNSQTLGRPYEVLAKATDPYLDWFRRFPALRTGRFDFTPVAALAALALINNVFMTIAFYGRISVGIILSMLLSAAWSAVSFILIFFVIVLVLRLFVFSQRPNSIMPFRQVLESITQPVLDISTKTFYRDRYISPQKAIVTAALVLLGGRVVGGFLVRFIGGLISRLPF